jgi:hypothetical protein
VINSVLGCHVLRENFPNSFYAGAWKYMDVIANKKFLSLCVVLNVRFIIVFLKENNGEFA